MSAWKCGHGGGVLVPSGAPALPAPKRPSELFAQALQCCPSCYPTGSMGSPKGFHPWSAGLFFPRFSIEEDRFSHRDRKLWSAQKLHIRRWPRKRKATPDTQEATSSCWEDTQGWVTFGQSTVPVPSLTRQMSVWLTWKGSNATLNLSQLSFRGHPKHLLHKPLTTQCWFLSLWRPTSHPGCAALNPKLREGQLGVWTSVMPFHNSTERKSSSSPKYKRDLKIILKLNKTGDIKMST